MTPRRNLVALFLSIGFLSFVVGNSDAQDQANGANRATVPDVIRISGASNPSQVPYSTKYSLFVSVYPTFRNTLLPQLSGNDDAILSALVDQEEYWVGVENAEHIESLRSLCSLRQSYNAVALANRSENLNKRFQDNRANRYRNAINAMSSEGKQAVEDFIESTIVPGTETGRSNIVEFAKAHPDDFAKSFEIDCYAAEHGKLPPDVQKIAEEEFEKRKREMGIGRGQKESSVEASTENLE